jgi:hypothetical protein
VLLWHDANGNLTYEDTRTRIAYNEINLPQQVQLLGGRGIKNVYAADGRKLKSEAKQGSEYIKEGTKTYCGNLVFDTNDELEYILFDEERILYNVDDSTYNYEYHLKDHLGSTRVAFVPAAQGTEVVQENNYYPFGAPINDLSWSPKSTNRYLREGKEYISDFDWNKYDFTGKMFDSWTVQALQIDPMAAEYYSTSPYALWINNPLRVIDPTGMWADDPENSSWWDKLTSLFRATTSLKSEEEKERFRGEDANRQAAIAAVEKVQPILEEVAPIGEAILSVVPFGDIMYKEIMGEEVSTLDIGVDVGIELSTALIPGGAAGKKIVKKGAEAIGKGIVKGAVHGNSLKSLRPTWGYKLFSNDGTFLKNGITSKAIPETRYPKSFMSDKYMKGTPFPNRKAAWDWEFQQNLIQKGPLNLNMH